MNEQQECCDTPRGFVGGTCDYCGGTVQPEAPEIKLTGAPETDACAKGIDQDNFEGSWRDDFEEFAWVPADFARQLERQRDEAREQLAAERELANRLAEVIQCVIIEERNLPVTSCRGFIDFDQAILAIAAWKDARRES